MVLFGEDMGIHFSMKTKDLKVYKFVVFSNWSTRKNCTKKWLLLAYGKLIACLAIEGNSIDSSHPFWEELFS